MNWQVAAALSIGVVLGSSMGSVLAGSSPSKTVHPVPASEFEWLAQQNSPNANVAGRMETLENQIRALEQRLSTLENGEARYIPVPSRQ